MADEGASLISALKSLADHPIDQPGTERVPVVLESRDDQEYDRPGAITSPEPVGVLLEPSQVQWLAQTLDRERATVQAAGGPCGHCRGTGRVHPAGAPTHILIWQDGQLTGDGSPFSSCWQLYTLDAWNDETETDTPPLLVLDEPEDADPLSLERRVAEHLAGQELTVRDLQRTFYELGDVPDLLDGGTLPGPHRRPAYEIISHPVRDADADTPRSEPEAAGPPPTPDPDDTAEQLLIALARLATAHPTDPEGTALMPIRIGNVHRTTEVWSRPAVLLQPGQLRWLAQIIHREINGAAEYHAAGPDALCPHCGGFAIARPPGPIAHVLAWFPGELLASDPDIACWEHFTAEEWNANDIGALLGGCPDATDAELTALLAGQDEDGGPWQLYRSTYTIAYIGTPGTSSYQQGPWTFPTVEAIAPIPAQ